MSTNFKFYCEKCDYGTNIKCNMKNHNKSMRHCSVKKNQYYYCQYCDYTTFYSCNMTKHLKTKKHKKKCPDDVMITNNYKVIELVSVPLYRPIQV